jgi:hypothetical protein
MSAHTPGPWAAPTLWDASGLTQNRVTHAPRGGEEWKRDTAVICVLPNDPSNRPNANIIAAAPDLLAIIEALVSMRDESDFTHEGAYEAFHKGGAEEVWERARAAIAKARGE